MGAQTGKGGEFLFQNVIPVSCGDHSVQLEFEEVENVGGISGVTGID